MSSWQVITASVRGSVHVRNQSPNQDAVGAASVPSAALALAAVSDGHGSERYVRSEVGARLAVQVALDVGRDVALAHASDTSAALAALQGRLVPALVDSWRAEVSTDAASRPFSDAEKARALGGAVLTAYGATLLLAAASPTSLLLFQLGDGDIVVVDTHGRATRPLPTDHRLAAGSTTSLCMDSAASDFRAVRIDDPDAVLVLLCTDGYGNSFADRDWHVAAGRDFQAAITAGGLSQVADVLPAWLGESAEASGDDTSLALLSRTDPAQRVSHSPDTVSPS